MRPEVILAELIARQHSKFDIGSFCFPEQLRFIKDESRFKTAVCSRRAGKTIACAADLVSTALQNPGVVALYITLSRKNAKRIIWPELLSINKQFDLRGHPNETDLSLKFPNGSVIYVSGAKDKGEIENFRGLPLKKVYVDECQSFRPYIEELIDDVLSKALFDYAGTLCLTGTPGVVPVGYFYNSSQSDRWSHHVWTMFQNPHLERKSGKNPMQLIIEDCERMGVSIDSPKIQRECFGKWVVDADSLIFNYDEKKNHFDELPRVPGKWRYIIGVDLGHDDADALAVIAYHENVKAAYLVDEIVKTKQGITELSDALERLVAQYDPDRIVMDTGGLGKKIAAEIQRRRSIPIQAAEKSRKLEFIELLNDAMRTGRFYASRGSRFAQDCYLVERDRDKTRIDKIVISEKYHSDICDAVLYAFRESLHWLSEPVKPKPKPTDPEYFAAEEREMEQTLIRELEAQKEHDFYDNLDLYKL